MSDFVVPIAQRTGKPCRLCRRLGERCWMHEEAEDPSGDGEDSGSSSDGKGGWDPERYRAGDKAPAGEDIPDPGKGKRGEIDPWMPIEGLCNGRRPGGEGLCRMEAGHNVPGISGRGRCSRHGGKTPTQLTKTRREIAAEKLGTYGLSIEEPPGMNPIEVFRRVIGRSYRSVRWLESEIRKADPSGITWGRVREIERDHGESGASASAAAKGETEWRAGTAAIVELYFKERELLRRYCRDALKAGVEEREIRLAERQADILTDAFETVLGRLGTEVLDDPEFAEREDVRRIVRSTLIAIAVHEEEGVT